MIQNNMSVRKNKRQARKYPSTDFFASALYHALLPVQHSPIQ